MTRSERGSHISKHGAKRFEYAALSDVGQARTQNEDAIYIHPSERLYLVADGMGGHQSGHVASQMCVNAIAQHYDETIPDADQSRRIAAAFTTANAKVFQASGSDPAFRGMGTTIVGAYIDAENIHIAHVGDSRCYRWRAGHFEQLTEDHSLANEYLRVGILKPDQIATFPYRNIITRAVGLSPSVEVSVAVHPHQPGDTFLLCSDGLSDMVSDQLLSELIATGHELETICRRMVDEANQAGGHDNISALLLGVSAA